MASPPLSAGQEVGRYRLVQRLGEGAFSEVWEAVHVRSGKRRALKMSQLPSKKAKKKRKKKNGDALGSDLLCWESSLYAPGKEIHAILCIICTAD